MGRVTPPGPKVCTKTEGLFWGQGQRGSWEPELGVRRRGAVCLTQRHGASFLGLTHVGPTREQGFVMEPCGRQGGHVEGCA